MIAKILQSGYNDSGSFPQSAIIPEFKGGLDKDVLSKRASIFDNDYDKFERKPGHTYIHLISVAAGEHYGPNSRADFYNGDSYEHEIPYPEKGMPKVIKLDGGLNKYHNATFMKEGGVYTEHFSSRDGAKPQGYIVAAKMNPAMHRGELIIGVRTNEWEDDIQKLSNGNPLKFSIGADTAKDTCFPKGTLVLTDNGYKPIESIVVGDAVKTAAGDISTVVATSVRYAEDLTRLNVVGFPLDIESTDNHPYYVTKAIKLRSCQGSSQHKGGVMKKRRHTPDEMGRCKTCNKFVDFSADWVSAKDIEEDDYLKIKLDDNAEYNTVGVPFAYLCGMYTGDGCIIQNNKSINNGLGDSKATGIGGIAISMSIDDVGQEITNKICRLIREVTGKEATVRKESGGKKAVVISVYDSLLGARIYELCGAGSRSKYISDQILNWSAEEKAAFVAGYIDADGCISPNSGAFRISSVNRGLVLSTQRMLWSIGIRATCFIGNYELHTFNGHSIKRPGHCYVVGAREANKLLCDNSVKLSKYPGMIGRKMNGANILLNQGYAYARVISTRSFKSAPIAVYNMEVAGHHTYNAEGADVHNCSYCGHVAYTEDGHCDHYKNNRGAITEDGHQIYVITDNCVFHDISRVRNPAEKIAFSIKKIAHADDFSLWQPGRVRSQSAKYMIKTASGQRRFETLNKLAKIEKEILAMATSGALDKGIINFFKLKRQQKKASDISGGEALNKFLASVSHDELFGALNKSGKILTPGEFVIVAVPKEYRDGGYGISTDTIESLIPGIFDRILHRDDVDSFCDDVTYDYSDVKCPASLVDMIKRVPCGCTTDMTDITKNLLSMDELDLTPSKKTIIIEISKPTADVNELIANDYANYVVSAVDKFSPAELAMSLLSYII